MCIVLLTTAHPSYALILIDNRDEFILRPTSRPSHWHHPNGPTVLSARDLQRAEKGTWLGITPQGVFAVLTNYRETDADDANHPVHGVRSRGGMVTYWLGTDGAESTEESIAGLVRDGGVKGVGGFSMLCGKLKRKRAAAHETNGVVVNGEGKENGHKENGVRNGELERNIEPIAIVSNRSEAVDGIPWVCGSRGEVCALSNACYNDADEWPKLENGKKLLAAAVRDAVAAEDDEAALVDRLFAVLDTDTLPRKPGTSLTEYISTLKHSIFIPPVGDEPHRREMEESAAKGRTGWPTGDEEAVEVQSAETAETADVAEGREVKKNGAVVDNMGFASGMYGTQRQTVVLVDWEGNVVFRERALFDANGNAVERGEGDVEFRFGIEGWEA
ncbi:related to mouse T10 protein [Cephalotrichum gorgonifer]|uniref:Related to mouse T10 protein n=1 Tax=Cephalotrichum gorgonifer TaxID=2041049 RepID=A0AAE8N6V0_9PEZI|nr:related to mouse T10 protein [Cephalotrichum gorgonifer]